MKKNYFFIILTVLILSAILCFFRKNTPTSKYSSIYCDLASSEIRNNNINNAIKYYEKALYHDPINAKAYYELGEIYRKNNDKEKMLQQFKEITAKKLLDPYVSKAYLEVGLDLFRNKELNRAIEHFKIATNLNRNLYQAYYYIGICYYIMEDKKNLFRQIRNLHALHEKFFKTKLKILYRQL